MVLSPTTGVSPTVSNEISALDIPGIAQQTPYTRVYPDGPSIANVVGYVGSATDPGSNNNVLTGQAGIEAQYNTLLSGHDGSEVVYEGTNGQQIPLEGGSDIPATNGSDVTLTINAQLQYAAQEACEKQVKAMHARDCTVVIMAPKTGDILAMAQWPQCCNSHGVGRPAGAGHLRAGFHGQGHHRRRRAGARRPDADERLLHPVRDLPGRRSGSTMPRTTAARTTRSRESSPTPATSEWRRSPTRSLRRCSTST